MKLMAVQEKDTSYESCDLQRVLNCHCLVVIEELLAHALYRCCCLSVKFVNIH